MLCNHHECSPACHPIMFLHMYYQLAMGWLVLNHQIFTKKTREGCGLFPGSLQGQCLSTFRPVFPVLVFQQRKQQNWSQTTSSTIHGTHPNHAQTKEFPLEYFWGKSLVSWAPKWESTENWHFHSLEPYTKPYLNTTWSSWFPQKMSIKIPGKIRKVFPNRNMLQVLGFRAPGKAANLPRTLGRHCPAPCPRLFCGAVFWNGELH